LISSITSPAHFFSSYGPGVADTKISRFTISSHSPNRAGRLSSAEGSRKPYWTSVSLRERSPSYMPADLRDGDVGLVDHHQEVLREVVEEIVGTLARLPPREVAGVVLDPGTVADLAEELHVVPRPALQPLGLEELPLGEELVQPRVQFRADRHDRPLHLVLRATKCFAG
jgi:hypothetical protein